jgi:hypothetical protein
MEPGGSLFHGEEPIVSPAQGAAKPAPTGACGSTADNLRYFPLTEGTNSDQKCYVFVTPLALAEI